MVDVTLMTEPTTQVLENRDIRAIGRFSNQRLRKFSSAARDRSVYLLLMRPEWVAIEAASARVPASSLARTAPTW